jgi:hypothetical protein
LKGRKEGIMKARILAEFGASKNARCQVCAKSDIPLRLIEWELISGYTRIARRCFLCSWKLLAESQGDPRVR